jgi:hypothetical protein
MELIYSFNFQQSAILLLGKKYILHVLVIPIARIHAKIHFYLNSVTHLNVHLVVFANLDIQESRTMENALFVRKAIVTRKLKNG